MSKKNKTKKQSIEIPKFIIYTGKFLELISTNLAVKYASKLFTTPIKYKVPKREFDMDNNSKQVLLFISKIDKSINIYNFGKGNKKVLLVHGWSGRGTQMFKIADKLIEKGYKVISFDAPAHGKSNTKSSMMPEFIESILEIDKKYGPFDYAIGHSLGGMAIMNALQKGFKTEKIITIGSGDKISDIVKDFVNQLQLKPSLAPKLTNHFEKVLNEKMADYDSNLVIRNCEIPHLIIHDKDDTEVGVYCADNIHKYSKNSTLFLTEGFGHRKILGSDEVIEQISLFID